MNTGVMRIDQDRELVQAAKTGSTSAFDQLVRLHARAAARLAGRLTGNLEDAEDVVQESFAKAFQNLDSFHERSSFRTWLLHITLHQAQDLLRRRARASRAGLLHTVDNDSATTDPGPIERVAARDQVAALTRALDDLPPRQKAALFLKVYEGLSYTDVAATLGTSVTAARVYLWLARQSLRRRFERLPSAGDST